MTRLCVPIFVDDLSIVRRDIAAAAEAGGEMIELRVDRFSNPEEFEFLIPAAGIPCIVTCRSKDEGGRSELSAESRVELLKNVEGASQVDVELAVGPALVSSLADRPRDRRAGLIVSSHDFKGRPDRLYNIIREMNALPGDINKIVWTARTIRDNLEAFELLQTKQKPTIALCMGEAGLISRVLAKKFGAFLTFAALTPEDATAPASSPSTT